jgi:hypothetical protein
MTAEEFKARLKAMDSVEKEEFKRKVGRNDATDEYCLDLFVFSTEWQSKFCYGLGVPSQADKVAKATFDAAWYAKAAFFAALAVGIPSLIVAVIALLK